MPMSQSRAARIAIAVVLAILSSSPVNAEDLLPEPKATESNTAPTEGRDLYLEVFINDASTKLIGAFKELPDGGLAATPDELREVGLKPIDAAIDANGLVRVDQLPDVSFQIDEATQRLYVRTTDEARSARVIDISTPEKQDRIKPQSGYGGVLNYTLFASTDDLMDRTAQLFRGVSGGFDARLFSPYGTLSQGFIASLTDGTFDGLTRLNTTWSYSDPERLLTYRAGDFVSGGLSWTRPVYLGGLQVQRNFSLRSDLVTLPLPSFSGTAAVPSTLEVYAQNVKTYTSDIPAGPFQVTNLPVFTGSGQAQIVLRDSLGRETTATLPFYNSSMLLRQGLLDFSAEIGYPRRNFGIESDDYDNRIYGSLSARYGLTNSLTLEGHFEAGQDLVNGGAGAAFPLGAYGAASIATAISRSGGQTGGLVNASIELSHEGWSVYGRIQRAFGDYQDIASVTAEANLIPGPGELPIFSTRVPRALSQVTLGVPLPIDFSSLNLSYAQIESAGGDKSQIVGLSYSQQVFKDSTVYATAFTDLDDKKSFGVFAGISVPIGRDVTASTGVEQGPDGASVVADIAKSEKLENGSIGWRTRTSEGDTPARAAAVSYRSPWARFEAGVQQYDKSVRGTAQVDGAVAVAGGGVFLANRIDDAFAVVDVGVAGVEVQHQNRPVGVSNRQGKLLVPDLNSYEPNTISIDPKNLPVDANVPETREVVEPADRSGVVLDFGVSDKSEAALVSFVDAQGKALPAGAKGHIESAKEEFVIGYEGETYIQGLQARNLAAVEFDDGTSCRAEFSYRPAPGTQVAIRNVKCQ
ncbi:fimbria/pilus outer membrane usher protein [Mesorhizobium sp. ArgA1]